MIEPLADKNLAQTSQQWLSDVARDTVIAPILSEEWTSIDGAPMLVVFNGATNSDKTENIYVLHGVRTFALRFPYIQDAATRSLCQRMLATFRFASSRK